MSELAKRLKAEQLNAIAAQRALLDAVDAEARELTADENETFTRTNDAYDSRAAHIAEIEATEQRIADYEASVLSLIHISEPTRPCGTSRMPSSA